MIKDIDITQLKEHVFSNELVHYDDQDFTYNYLYSDFYLDGLFFLPISSKTFVTSSKMFGIFNEEKYKKYFQNKYFDFIKKKSDNIEILSDTFIVGSLDNYYHCLLEFYQK